MRLSRIALPLAVLLTLPLFSPVWARADGHDDRGGRHLRVSEYAEGHAYCPRRSVVVGAVVVPAGRCYTLAVLRNDRGAYLAFLDPGVRLHRDEAAYLGSAEGRRAWDRILFLVPIPSNTRIALIPRNTIQLVRMREENEDEDEDQPRARRSSLVVVVPASTLPSISPTFVIVF